MILLGSVSRKYLLYLLTRKLGPEPGLNVARRRSKTASEIMNTINNFRQLVWELTELGDLFQKEFLYECQCSVDDVQSERNAHRQTHLWKYPTSSVTATRWAGNFDDYLSHNILNSFFFYLKEKVSNYIENFQGANSAVENLLRTQNYAQEPVVVCIWTFVAFFKFNNFSILWPNEQKFWHQRSIWTILQSTLLHSNSSRELLCSRYC